MGSLTLEDYSDITLEHLNELEIIQFSDAENELDFVKLIMAKSPVLKKVWISPCYDFDKDKESEIIKILCCTPCAAPLVDIMW
ncbi:putative FBD domain-containing protein [Helianthus anomalus]